MVSTEKEILKAGDYVWFQFCYTAGLDGRLCGQLTKETFGTMHFTWVLYRTSHGVSHAAHLSDIAFETMSRIPEKEVFKLKLKGMLV